jgi:drug/metabolite transporter (DMT)-like permease
VFGALRYTIASVVFVAITLVREKSIRPRRQDWLVLGVFAVFATLVNQLAFFYAIHLATASTVSLVFGALPAFVGMIGIAQGLRKPSARHWLATTVSFVGVALVAVGGSASLSGDLGGVLLALVAVGCYALYTIAVSRLSPAYSPYRISALISVGVAIPLLAFSSPKLATTHWSQIGGLSWLALVYSTILGFVLANVLWIAAIKRTGPNRSSLFANLQVFGGAAVGVLLLNESMSGLEIAGGAVIAVGIVLSARRLKLPTRSATLP